MNAIAQAEFDFSAPASLCEHEFCYQTFAFVPGGIVCDECDRLLWQFIPQSPETVGYLTADWAWHHRDGKPWTTQPPMH